MTEKLLCTTTEAAHAIGCGRTRLYELMGEGRLDARSCGGRTLVTMDSLRRFADSLPRADIRAKEAA